MGVNNLWKLLKESHCTNKNMNWNTMNGSIWAVDLSFWIVEASTAMQHVKATDSTFRPHLRNLFFRIKHLLSLGIRLVFVFDGAPPPQKFETLRERGVLGNINRRNNKKKYSQSVFGRQCKQCKELLKILGFPFIDLKYGEAEAFCSKLNKYGIVNAVLTPDGDSFLFGANKIFTQYQKTNPLITCCNIAQSHLNQRKFIALGLLLGSDYCKGVKGIGYKTANKLLENAMNEYGINSYNDNNDALFHIIKWCSMNDDEINILFNRKKNKQSQTFINKMRKTYNDNTYLMDIVNAYLKPTFHRTDEQKLADNKWLKWKCPDFKEMMMFSQQYFQIDLKHIMQHTLDIALDLYLFGFIDCNHQNIFKMNDIIKSRIRNKCAMFSIQWQCNDIGINEVLQEQDIKCEGLHWADAIKQLHPNKLRQFEIATEENKKNKKPKTKKKNTENEIKKTTKKKDNKHYSQKTDWKQPINTERNALIYTENINELNELNDLLGSISLKGSKKKGNINEYNENENINHLNQVKRRKKRVIKSKQRKRANKCLLQISDDDDDDNYNKHKAKKYDTNNGSNNDNMDIGWNCKLCTYFNRYSSSNDSVCGMCGIQKKVRSQNDDLLSPLMNKLSVSRWECNGCTFSNDYQDKICIVCGYNRNKDESRDSESDDVWDLSEYSNTDRKSKKNSTNQKRKQKHKKKSEKVLEKQSILNTSTSTATWKCSYCKKMIPIHVFECPNCT